MVAGYVSAEPLGLGRKVEARWADKKYMGIVTAVTSSATRRVLYAEDGEQREAGPLGGDGDGEARGLEQQVRPPRARVAMPQHRWRRGRRCP